MMLVENFRSNIQTFNFMQVSNDLVITFYKKVHMSLENLIAIQVNNRIIGIPTNLRVDY